MTPRPFGTVRRDLKPRGKRPLRDARLGLDLTQRECAEIFGIAEITWRTWERGKVSAPHYWMKLLIADADEIKKKRPARKGK